MTDESLKDNRKDLRSRYVEWSHIPKAGLENISGNKPDQVQTDEIKNRLENESILLNNIVYAATRLHKTLEKKLGEIK